MNGSMDERIIGFMEYTKRRNLNREYMKVEVWQRGMDLFELGFRLARHVSDFKLKFKSSDSIRPPIH